MTGRERVLRHLEQQPVDRLPAMPITMRLACRRISARYRDYCTDHRVLAEGQIRTAEDFGLDYVNTMSDPAREAADCGAVVDFFDDPGFVRDLFDFVVEMEVRFAREQLRAGADLIGIGDAAASLVGPQIYEQFVWPQEKRLVDAIHAMGGRTRLHICGNTSHLLAGMGRLGCHVVDLDSLAPLSRAREQMGPAQVLLGNVNPVTVMREGTPALVTKTIAECHRQAGPRFIVGAGCEVPPDTPENNLRALVTYAKATAP